MLPPVEMMGTCMQATPAVSLDPLLWKVNFHLLIEILLKCSLHAMPLGPFTLGKHQRHRHSTFYLGWGRSGVSGSWHPSMAIFHFQVVVVSYPPAMNGVPLEVVGP